MSKTNLTFCLKKRKHYIHLIIMSLNNLKIKG